MRVVIGGSEQEIKSCPCCDSDKLFIGQSAFLHYAIQCNSCGLKLEKTIRNKKSKRSGLQVHLQCAAKVITAWNTRCGESEPYHLSKLGQRKNTQKETALR